MRLCAKGKNRKKQHVMCKKVRERERERENKRANEEEKEVGSQTKLGAFDIHL